MSPNLDRIDRIIKFNEKTTSPKKERRNYNDIKINNSNYYGLIRINKQIIKSRQSIVLVFTFLLIILILTLPESLLSQNILITTSQSQLTFEESLADSNMSIHEYKSHINCSNNDCSPITEQMTNQRYVTSELTGYAPLLQHNNFNSDRICNDIAYNSVIEHSENKPVLQDNLKTIRRQLLQRSNHWLTKELKDKRDRYFSEDEILNKQWFQFGGSSVWLEKEQCYLVFSRIVYSRLGRRNRPYVSLVRGQAFDKDWNEIIGKKISYMDVKNDGIEQTNELNDKILSRYYVTYPNIFDIPFGIDGDWNGPEDPHIILKRTNNSEEPIIFLNMFDTVEGKRRMYSFMPHRKIDSLIKLQIPNKILKKQEKNWTPFFHPSDLVENGVRRGFVHFIYTLSPLDILKCSLDDGVCDIEFSSETISDKFDVIRGGSQFIQVPSFQTEGSIDKNIWIGFPKIHMSDCGCGEFFYRPMLVVLSEIDLHYQIDFVLPIVDFNIDVLSWDMATTECKETNIMSPNSIIHWDIKSGNNDNSYEDYMSLTLSEADSLTKRITIKGIMNLVTELYDNEIQLGYDTKVSKLLMSCSIDKAQFQCSNYGNTHLDTDTHDLNDYIIFLKDYIIYIWITIVCTLFP